MDTPAPGVSDGQVASDGPVNHHVYIGHLDEQKDLGDRIRKRIEGLLFTTYPGKAAEDSQEDYIENGIISSQKVVLVFSPEYQKDERISTYERRMALENARRRGTRSLILYLAGMTSRQLSPSFRDFPTICDWNDGDDDEDNNHAYLEMILHKESSPIGHSSIQDNNMGYTLACSWLYGYLRAILFDMAQRIKCSPAYTEAEPGVTVQMSTKLLLICPESCYCPLRLSEYVGINMYKEKLAKYLDRSGKEGREYSSPVYEIREGDTVYRAVAEFASCMRVLYDMVLDGRLTQKEATREMKYFYHCVKDLFRSVNGVNPRQIHLIYLTKDVDANQNQMKSIIISAIKAAIKAEQNETNSPEPKETDKTLIKYGFEEDKSLTALYNGRDKNVMLHYTLTNKPRGKAYIISNVKFTKKSKLGYREGAENDQETMEKLFEYLHFDVEVMENKTAQEIRAIGAMLSSMKCEDDQAIAVCLMSHGRLGQVYGVDGDPVSILDFTVDLAKNETLERNPKLLFIQACQIALPLPPRKLEAHTLTSTSLCLKWTPEPQDREIKLCFYVVQYKVKGSFVFSTYPNTPKTNSIEISGLSPGVTYVYRVAGCNQLGCGDYSDELEAKTNPENILKNSTSADADLEDFRDLRIRAHEKDISSNDQLGSSRHHLGTGDDATQTGERVGEKKHHSGEKRDDCLDNPVLKTGASHLSDVDEETAKDTDSDKAKSEIASSKCIGPEKISDHLVPRSPHFMLSLSTLPGRYSYRDIYDGSPYIKALNDNIRAEENRDLPLDRILMKVTTSVRNDSEENANSDPCFQYPFFVHTTDQLIFLRGDP